MDLLIFLLFATLALLFIFVIVFSFNTLGNWQETHLKILKSGRDRAVGLFFFSALCLCFINLCLRVHCFRWPPFWHKLLLATVVIYVSIFFNPQQHISNAKSENSVHCPDGYAYRLDNDQYIRCEDFNEYFEARYNGQVKSNLYIKGK